MWSKTGAAFLPAYFALGPLLAHEARSEVYMSDQKARELIFPGLKMEKKTIPLKPEEAKQISEKSGEKVRGEATTAWVSAKGEFVFIDQVLGKHEFITYAVGIDSQGKVKGIEILEYRESYGQNVRDAKWRVQFVGKDKSAPLKVNEDIKNLSGATLSSSHISGGVRRILITYEIVKSRG